MIFDAIIWDVNPDIFVIPGIHHPIRWYGLLFALGFILSQQIMYYIFKKEDKPIKHIDSLTLYMVIGTVLGARLGHCLFYDPSYYLSHPFDILKIWEGGLASHGGAIGILIALWLFCKKHQYSYLWILDRIVIVVCLTGALIRFGNLMNSEMEGLPTQSDFGIVYARFTKAYLERDKDIESIEIVKNKNKEAEKPGIIPLQFIITYTQEAQWNSAKIFTIEGLKNYKEITQHIVFDETVDYDYQFDNNKNIATINAYGIARHAGQLYESVYCIILMLILYGIWSKKRNKVATGFSFALFMIILWVSRFIDEYFKMNQVAFEDDMTLNMGQWLSIPMILVGVYLMFTIHLKKSSK